MAKTIAISMDIVYLHSEELKVLTEASQPELRKETLINGGGKKNCL